MIIAPTALSIRARCPQATESWGKILVLRKQLKSGTKQLDLFSVWEAGALLELFLAAMLDDLAISSV